MRSGIDRAAMDTTIRPQDDLYGHINGGWTATATMPPDRGRFGSFDILRDRAEADMRALLEESGERAGQLTGEDTAAGGLARALYGVFLDEDRAEALGLTPIEGLLAEAAAVADGRAAMLLLGRLQREGVGGLVDAYVNTDFGDPDRYVTYLEQSGLGLPDEAYYREDSYAAIRDAYVTHLTKIFTLAGVSDARGDADAVMGLETRLAAGHWDRVARRDAVKSYTLTDLAGLTELAPEIPWRGWLEAAGAPPVDAVVMRQPSYLTALSDAIREVGADAWRAWLRSAILHAYAPFLHRGLVEENFDFYGRTLSGTPEQRARWKRGVALVDQLMGEDAGRLYVAEHFPVQAKERMVELVGNLVEAYRRDITELAWMTPATREKALEKLALFTPKIGYPETWRDYSGLELLPGDLLGSVRAAYAFETDRMWAKLGGPIDRGEWFMNAQTVNAYYNPGMNEIVFPAAILQPPFFDVEADDAVNYGAIGSVIGHEIGHGFDDQGSRYDGRGQLVDWWTQADREAFEGKTAVLIRQYDGFRPRELPEEHVNGALTVGENIGDLGGVTIAHLAYRLARGDGPVPVIDEMTGDQRFFAGWAQIWRMIARPEEAKRLLAVDPHSPGEFRANILRNLTEFYDAYDVHEGDALWLSEAERVRIW